MKKATTTVKAVKRKSISAKADAHGMTPQDWAKLKGMSDADVLEAARADPDAKPLEDRATGSVGRTRRVAQVKRIRWQLKMSQAEFARAFRIPIGTLRDWEQHRREPDQAARAYLDVITHETQAVRRALVAAK